MGNKIYLCEYKFFFSFISYMKSINLVIKGSIKHRLIRRIPVIHLVLVCQEACHHECMDGWLILSLLAELLCQLFREIDTGVVRFMEHIWREFWSYSIRKKYFWQCLAHKQIKTNAQKEPQNVGSSLHLITEWKRVHHRDSTWAVAQVCW